MGYDAYSLALIGIQVDKRDLFTKKVVKSYEHDHPQAMKFDPYTGNKLWKEESVPIEGLEGDDESEMTFHGFKVIMKDNEAYFVLDSACTTWRRSGSKSAFTPLQKSKNILMQHLLPLGLWNEGKFGLWAVLLESS